MKRFFLLIIISGFFSQKIFAMHSFEKRLEQYYLKTHAQLGQKKEELVHIIRNTLQFLNLNLDQENKILENLGTLCADFESVRQQRNFFKNHPWQSWILWEFIRLGVWSVRPETTYPPPRYKN
jgi:hypothetical protein